MPAGDRKIARYLRELALNAELHRLTIASDVAVRSAMRGLTGGEMGRAARLVREGNTPQVSIRVRWIRLKAGAAQ